MAGPKSKRTASDPRGAADAVDASSGASAFAVELGQRLRSCRAKRGMTRQQLAQRSGTSERYLAQIESGQGNPSVIVLKSIAQALDMPMVELLPSSDRQGTAFDRVVDLLMRVPAAELPAIAEAIERHGAPGGDTDRARRIALVGLRGAGKSTLGSMLARRLDCPFIELDRLVEQEYGARIPDLVEIAGLATFRRYERTCLERVVRDHATAVIAAAGGIVSNAQTYGLLLGRSHTVWIKAKPEEHMQRVMAQGDFRPMARSREAMADLVAILEARGADYARAEAAVDTSDASVEQSFARLCEISDRILGRSVAVATP